MTQVPVKDIATIIMGTAPPGKSYNMVGDGIPMIAGAGDYGDIHPKTKKWTTQPTALAQAGDLIVCVRATIGDINWADREYCLGRGVAAIRPIDGKVDKRFLAHFFGANKPALSRLGTGTTFLAIRRGDIENFPIPLPPLSEQKRIADILDKADGIRRKRLAAVSSLSNVRQSALYETVLCSPDRGKWDTDRLGGIADVQGGIALSSRRKILRRKAPYLRVANVYRESLNLNEIKEVGVADNEFDKTVLAPGDVLVVEGHGNREEIGRSAIWDGSIEGCVHHNHLIRVRPNKSILRSVFLSAFLNSQLGRSQLFRFGKTTSGLNTISLSNVRDMKILVPPLPLQQKMEELVRNFENAMSRLLIAHEETDFLFNSLVQRAFKGEL